MSKELIKISMLCRMCFENITVEKTRELLEFIGLDPDDQEGKAHMYVCKDCKKQFGDYF